MTAFTLKQLENNQGFRVETPYDQPGDRKAFGQVLNAAAGTIALSDGTKDTPRIMVDQAGDALKGTRGFEISTPASHTEVARSISAGLKAPRR